MFAFSNRLYCLTNSRKAKAIRKDREKQQIHTNDKLEIMETPAQDGNLEPTTFLLRGESANH